MKYIILPDDTELLVLVRRAHENGDAPVLKSVYCIDQYTLLNTKAVMPPTSLYDVDPD
jgi:hypothetical protein